MLITPSTNQHIMIIKLGASDTYTKKVSIEKR
jgi:hypothetical protein